MNTTDLYRLDLIIALCRCTMTHGGILQMCKQDRLEAATLHSHLACCLSLCKTPTLMASQALLNLLMAR